jgi:hypothetical protein
MTTNAPATQTRTAEIVELTVAARTLPTQNAAVPPTPVPTPAPAVTLPPLLSPVPQIPTAVPTPVAGYDPTALDPNLPGSWVAYSPTLRVRFFAPPSLVEAPDFNTSQRYSLSSPSNVYDFEALDIFRFVGNRGGDFASTWSKEIDSYKNAPNHYAFYVTSGPRQQQVGAFQGNAGQFNYLQTDNELQISGTMWVGQVGGDEVVIVYRCAPDRERLLDEEFAQIIRTIDFNAR